MLQEMGTEEGCEGRACGSIHSAADKYVRIRGTFWLAQILRAQAKPGGCFKPCKIAQNTIGWQGREGYHWQGDKCAIGIMTGNWRRAYIKTNKCPK